MTQRPRRNKDKDLGETLEQVWAWISKPTWSKIGTGVMAILVGLWGYLNLGDGIESADKRLDTHGDRLTSVERELDHIDQRFDDLDQRAEDLEAGGEDLNESIERAVRRGIERGIEQALRRLEEQ